MRSPNANTAIKLAAFYTILDHLDDGAPAGNINEQNSFKGYSMSAPEAIVQFDGESEFAQTINGRDQSEVWPVMDELMSTIKIMNERLYNGVMRKLQ